MFNLSFENAAVFNVLCQVDRLAVMISYILLLVSLKTPDFNLNLFKKRKIMSN